MRGLRRRTAGLLALAALAAMALGCTGGDGDSPDVRIEPTAAASATSATPPPAATATPATTAEIITTPVPANGSPFGGADLIAVLADRGVTSAPQDQGVSCGPDVPPGVFYHARSDVIPPDPMPEQGFTLFVYPAPEVLAADWLVDRGARLWPLLGNCGIGAVAVYYHENLLMIFNRISNVEMYETIVEAFQALTSASTSTLVQGGGGPLSALAGSPLDGAAFGRALEARGLTIGPGDLHHECDELGWPRSAWYAIAGSYDLDEMQVFLLWVYPDREALRADWTARPGAAPSPADERCVIESGWRYWNANMVLVFETVRDDALRRAVVEAFLGLSR